MKKKSIQFNVIGIGFSDYDQTILDDTKPEPGALFYPEPPELPDVIRPGVAPGETVVIPRSPTQVRNEQLLRQMACAVNGSVLSANEAMDVLQEFRKKSVRGTTLARTVLEIGNPMNMDVEGDVGSDPRESGVFKIRVWTYAKTMDQRANFHKQSIFGDGSVKMSRVYQDPDDVDTVLDEDARLRAFRYGKSLIPFSDFSDAELKFFSEKSMKMLGFINEDKLPRYYLIGKCDVCVPEPGDEHAARAMAALVYAMKEKKKIGIVRYVKRMNAPIIIGALVPTIDPITSSKYFYIIPLPYDDDVRHYKFNSLSYRKAFVPSTVQDMAMKDFVDTMTDDALYEPEETFNPVLQRVYAALRARALDDKAPLNEAEIKQFDLEKNSDLEAKVIKSHALDNLLANFKTEVKDKDKVNKKKWRGRADIADLLGDIAVKAETDLAVGAAVSKIGDSDPAFDFRAIMSKHPEHSRSVEIMKEMFDVIMTLIRTSMRDQLYPRAMSALKEARKYCVDVCDCVG